MRVAFAVALAILLFGSALSAGTVTLTGSCKNALQAGNTLVFSLSNSGNDTAYNLILAPKITGAVPQNSTYHLPSLGPESNYNLSIPLKDITMMGGFVDAVLVSYQQGSLFVTDIFPCYVTMGNVPASSDIYLSALSSSKNGIATISVSAYNAGRMPLSANVSLMLPPTFKFLTNTSFTADLAPYSSKNFTFAVQPESPASSVGGAVASSYVFNGIHYSSIALVVVKSNAGSNSGALAYAFFILVIAFVAVIVALILRIAYRNRKRSTQASQ